MSNTHTSEAKPETTYLKDYQVPKYLIETVDLNFILEAEYTRVVSRLTITHNPDNKAKHAPLELLGEELTLISIALDGVELTEHEYKLTDDSLSIVDVPQNTTFTLAIENTINPKANSALEGLFVSNNMLCTQCEAQGFRKITYFLDRPDVMARFTTTLIADKTLYPVLLSNGNKVAQGELIDNRHWVTWEDPFKKPCYLFALVAGELECIEDHYTTMSGRKISLQIFVEAHDVDKCAHAMQSLKNAMRWDEQVYGREYDLDLYMIVAVGHFNMGAMENKGLNIFNTKFVLARPDTATDMDYEHIEGVIGHEYFHNWTGNRITCRDWFQLSLKEGFTVFRDQEFTADQTSKAVKRIDDVNMLRTRQFAEDAGPLAHPIRPEAYIEINNFYTLTVYEKGAEIVRMLRTLLGTEHFHKGADLYFQRHDGQAVTCEHFVQAMEDANDKDLSQFRCWYAQAGTPIILAEQAYDAERQALTLTLSQTIPKQVNPATLHIPIKVALFAENGSTIDASVSDVTGIDNEFILELIEQRQSFVFENVPSTPILSILRDFSAPVKLQISRPLTELAFLLQHDNDSFNRWEAGQQLMACIIFELIKAIKQEQSLTIPDILVDSFTIILDQEWPDLSYLACLLSLPAENYLAEQMPVVDVDAIHQARQLVKRSLAEQLTEQLTDLYHQNNQRESGELNSDAIGKRKIKNLCLDYLSQLDTKYSYQLANEQFANAKTMTDQIAALGAIVNTKNPDKITYLEQFYQQWQEEALVIDKWFSLQAASSQPGTFAVVQSLLQHAAFDLKNPNRVRSLVGAFSQANPIHYHAKNGQGYQFLADQVIALNSINPQVASRMVGALTQWRRFDEQRQGLMKQQLERIIKTENISKDVFEIASKSLV
ncbi:aminopeptidase N [Methylococcaceae bacterium HT4]|nr:aminopeptidase N [Methylococcaceae bacterium HT4]TXL20974.1 aminopeptidase N [Methylococcaceae bacterium HT5]